MKRNVHGWPLRAIVSRSVRVRRGRGTYVDEYLECGHSFKYDGRGSSGAVRRAKRRGCYDCHQQELTSDRDTSK